MTIIRRDFRGSAELPSGDVREIHDAVRNHGLLLEQVRAGRVAAALAFTAAPVSGTWTRGDFVRNAEPAEAGTAGSKYVVTGWICSASGSPGTWLACRALTGN